MCLNRIDLTRDKCRIPLRGHLPFRFQMQSLKWLSAGLFCESVAFKSLILTWKSIFGKIITFRINIVYQVCLNID